MGLPKEFDCLRYGTEKKRLTYLTVHLTAGIPDYYCGIPAVNYLKICFLAGKR